MAKAWRCKLGREQLASRSRCFSYEITAPSARQMFQKFRLVWLIWTLTFYDVNLFQNLVGKHVSNTHLARKIHLYSKTKMPNSISAYHIPSLNADTDGNNFCKSKICNSHVLLCTSPCLGKLHLLWGLMRCRVIHCNCTM